MKKHLVISLGEVEVERFERGKRLKEILGRNCHIRMPHTAFMRLDCACYNQAEAAFMLGVSQAFFSRMATGQVNVTGVTVDEFERAFGVRAFRYLMSECKYQKSRGVPPVRVDRFGNYFNG